MSVTVNSRSVEPASLSSEFGSASAPRDTMGKFQGSQMCSG